MPGDGIGLDDRFLMKAIRVDGLLCSFAGYRRAGAPFGFIKCRLRVHAGAVGGIVGLFDRRNSVVQRVGAIFDHLCPHLAVEPAKFVRPAGFDLVLGARSRAAIAASAATRTLCFSVTHCHTDQVVASAISCLAVSTSASLCMRRILSYA